jgi:hypothetical protein
MNSAEPHRATMESIESRCGDAETNIEPAAIAGEELRSSLDLGYFG